MNEKEKITEMHSDIKYIKEAIEKLTGNVDKNTQFRISREANDNMLKALFGGGVVFSIIAILISLLK